MGQTSAIRSSLIDPIEPPDLSVYRRAEGAGVPSSLHFILMNLRSMSERGSEERQMWISSGFPQAAAKPKPIWALLLLPFSGGDSTTRKMTAQLR